MPAEILAGSFFMHKIMHNLDSKRTQFEKNGRRKSRKINKNKLTKKLHSNGAETARTKGKNIFKYTLLSRGSGVRIPPVAP